MCLIPLQLLWLQQLTKERKIPVPVKFRFWWREGGDRKHKLKYTVCLSLILVNTKEKMKQGRGWECWQGKACCL